MPVITEADIRALTAVRSNGTLVTTCYLDVDGGRYVRPADYQRSLDDLVRRARGRDVVDGPVEADIARIVARVGEGFDRTTTRGVAIFSSQAHDLFVVHELPVPVRNELVVNPTPAVGQLERVLQQSEKVAVLAADKQHARVFVYRLGELVEHVVSDDHVVGRGTADVQPGALAHDEPSTGSVATTCSTTSLIPRPSVSTTRVATDS